MVIHGRTALQRPATPEEARATEGALARLDTVLAATEVKRISGSHHSASTETPKSGPATASDQDMEWRTSYSMSPALQAEFGRVEAYVAYRRAEAEGRVRPSRTAFAATRE